MMFRASFRLAAVGGLSGAMLASLTVEEMFRAMSDERREAYVRTWARSLLKLLGVELTIDAAPGVFEKGGRPRLVVANHRSTIDILVMLSLFGGHLLARGDMAGWPAIGVMARRAGTLFVDRANPASGAAAVQRIRERLRRRVTICVFPEGTTYPGDEVREFQAGTFVAIARERGEVVPVGIAYETPEAIYGDEPIADHMKRLVRTPSIRVGVAVGAPVDVARNKITSLTSELRGNVQGLVFRARSLVERAKAEATLTAL